MYSIFGHGNTNTTNQLGQLYLHNALYSTACFQVLHG